MKKWKADPQSMVMTAVIACLAIAWCIFSIFMQLVWADWLFLPMLCIAGVPIFMEFRKRKLRSGISAVASFFFIASAAIGKLMTPLGPEHMELRLWIFLGCLAVAICLRVVSQMLQKDDDAPTDS